MYDLSIIGGGPAGATAAVYAARKRLKTLCIVEEWGGQSNVSEDIQNWIGTPHISGSDLAKSFEAHVREYAHDVLEVVSPARATSVERFEEGFRVTTDKEETYEARALFIGVGSRRRRLSVKGADTFEHKGLTYCATCDGPLFSGRDVVVIGGGNAGFETAAQLLEYAKSVTLLEYNSEFLADEITVEKLRARDTVTGITHAETTEIIGDQFVTGLRYRDRESDEEKELTVGGIFVEIGMIPNTDILADVVELDARGRIIVDPYTQETKTKGVWAAGDCTDVLYHQNNIASGDAVKAIEHLYYHLR